MNRKPAKSIVRAFVLAVAVAGLSAAPAAAVAQASPGACNMLNVSPKGMDGMLKASEQGLGNMMALVIASEESGCTI